MQRAPICPFYILIVLFTPLDGLRLHIVSAPVRVSVEIIFVTYNGRSPAINFFLVLFQCNVNGRSLTIFSQYLGARNLLS